MRFLFVTSPLVGHLFPLVPQAWAARAAGHDVMVATAGEAADPARLAGLPVVDVADGQDPVARLRSGPPAEHSQQPGSDLPPPDPQPAFSPQSVAEPAPFPGPLPTPGPSPVSGPLPAGTQGTPPQFAAMLFGACGEAMAEGVIELASDWRPDCVVHSALDGAGPIAAARLGVPLVRHTFAMGAMAPELTVALRQVLEPVWRKYGEPAEPIAVIDPGPRSVRLVPTSNAAAGPASGLLLPCQFVPFNGSGALPTWLLRPSSPRPRLCLTLGTVIPRLSPTTMTMLLDAVSTLDVDVVLANGQADPAATGALPPNVRPAGYVPLSALLPTCAAIVHHGGAGTTATALATGLPQLALPHMADQFDVSAAIHRRGLALLESSTDTTPSRLRAAIDRVLTDPALRRQAAAVAAENAELPAPTTVMCTLADELQRG